MLRGAVFQAVRQHVLHGGWCCHGRGRGVRIEGARLGVEALEVPPPPTCGGWVRRLTEDGGVEANLGPRAWSINADSRNKVWRLLEAVRDTHAGVVATQEARAAKRQVLELVKGSDG